MKVRKIEVGSLLTNCYILELDSQGIIIDPGAETKKIYEAAKNLDIKFILLTHGHFDHILGVTQLKKLFPKAKILLHKNDLGIYENVADQLAYFFNQKEEIKLPHPELLIKEKGKINFGDCTIKILPTPGHTAGSVTFLVQNMAFVGDLIFKGGFTGRTDLESGDENEIKKSIAKILKLPPLTTIYPGHGEEFKLPYLSGFPPEFTRSSFTKADGNNEK